MRPSSVARPSGQFKDSSGSPSEGGAGGVGGTGGVDGALGPPVEGGWGVDGVDGGTGSVSSPVGGLLGSGTEGIGAGLTLVSSTPPLRICARIQSISM